MSNRRSLMLSQPPTTTLQSLYWALVATAALLLSSACAHSTPVVDVVGPMPMSLRLQAIRDLADAVRTCYGVPGLAVGFSSGSERQAFGLGVADVKLGTPVTEHTVFGVGSLTKAFSSALLAELLPTSGLHWNSPLKDFIPGFRMNTTFLTENVTLADVLAHRTGVVDFLPAILAGYPIDVDRREMQRRAQYYKPTRGFRRSVSYNNHLYALGGAVVEHLTGMSWEQLINATLFTRLNMTSSSFTQWWKDVPKLSKMYSEQARGGNAEMPFEPLELVGPLGPAGSILSSANDMVKWLEFALEKTNARNGTWPQVFPSNVCCSVGLGWFEGRYGDIPFWQHAGSIEGYCSIATLLHHHNASIFVTANKWCGHVADVEGGFGSALQPLTRLLAETLLGLPVTTNAQAICGQRANWSAAAENRTALPPSAEGDGAGALKDRAHCAVGSGKGRFSNPAFGDVVIASNGSSLRWQYGRSGGSLLPARSSLPENRSYVMQFEDLRDPSTRQRILPLQLVLTISEDCGSLWLLDRSEVAFVQQSEGLLSQLETSSGDPSCRLSECGVRLSPLFSVIANLYAIKCLLN